MYGPPDSLHNGSEAERIVLLSHKESEKSVGCAINRLNGCQDKIPALVGRSLGTAHCEVSLTPIGLASARAAENFK